MKLAFGLLYLAVVLTLVFFVGPFCVNFVLLHIAHHTIAYGWAFLLSLVTGELTIPAAIVVKVLVLLGILA